MSIMFWNIRGLNSPSKKKVLVGQLKKFHVGLCCLAEAKIKLECISKDLKGLRDGWNNVVHTSGPSHPRIIV